MERYKKIKLTFTVEEEGVTLRQWIKHNFPHITYERLQQSIRKGDVRVNSLKTSPQNILQRSDIITLWDKLILDDTETVKIEPKYWEKIKLVEQNDDFWVIDKPYGVPTQGGHNIKVSMVDILQGWMGTKPYIVHRLDRCTTGLFVIALHSYAARDLGESLKNRTWKKVYHAKLDGVVTKERGTITQPVFGKEATTKYRLISTDGVTSLVEFTPITGRKHQIRQHATKFLYPVVGDEIYGQKSKEKMYLRCVHLKFVFRGTQFEFNLS